MDSDPNRLAPDLIGYIKLLARKRDALVMGRQESDDKKYSLTVYESLTEVVANIDEKMIALIRISNGDILIKKTLLEMSEMSVFFWLVFSNLRPKYQSSIETDAAAWEYLLENYRSGTRQEYGQFYEEFSDYLMEYVNDENVEEPFGKFIERRNMLMYELTAMKIVDID